MKPPPHAVLPPPATTLKPQAGAAPVVTPDAKRGMSLHVGAGSYNWDRSPAHLEADVLGCLLARPDAEAGEAIDRLSDEAFNHPHLRAIYHAIRTLRADGIPADPVAVTDRMRAEETLTERDLVYLLELAEAAVAPSLLSSLVMQLRHQALERLRRDLARALIDTTVKPAELPALAAVLRHVADALDDGRPDQGLHELTIYYRHGHGIRRRPDR